MQRLVVLAALLAAPALAQENGAEAPGPGFAERLAEEGRDLSPGEWRGLTAGRTVWYRIGEDLWGRERYDAAGERLTFQFADGTCIEADWIWIEPWFCFQFDSPLAGEGPHCFRHLEHEGRLWALGLQGSPQAVDRIDSAPLACGPDPVS